MWCDAQYGKSGVRTTCNPYSLRTGYGTVKTWRYYTVAGEAIRCHQHNPVLAIGRLVLTPALTLNHRRNHGPKSGGTKRGPKGRSSKPEGLRVGGGFLGRGQRTPSPPARGSGERCKLPQRDSGRSPEKKVGFWCILGLNFAVFHVLNGQNLGDE